MKPNERSLDDLQNAIEHEFQNHPFWLWFSRWVFRTHRRILNAMLRWA